MAIQYSSRPDQEDGGAAKYSDQQDWFYVEVPSLEDEDEERQRKYVGVRENVSPHDQGTTFLRTCLNGLNALSGVGILSVPYAVSEGGWASLALLLLIATICCYTGILLQKCMSAAPRIRSYPDIGDLAFGYKGRLAVSVFMFTELYLVAIEFLILEGDNLNNLFPGSRLRVGGVELAGKKLFTVVAALLILPTAWLRNLGVLAFVSAGGVLASVIVMASVVYVGAFDGVEFNNKGTFFNLNGLSTSLGLYSFCYCGHAVFPTICTSMRNTANFSKVLLVCFVLCTLNYGTMAVSGYLMYGNDLESQITLNLPKGSVSARIAIFTTLIGPFTKYALMIHPLASPVEERLSWISGGRVGRGWLSSLLVRTALVSSTVVVAVSVPLFGYLMALIGSCLGMIVSIVLPCLCYLKIFAASPSSVGDRVLVVGILLVGVALAVVGTYASLRQIVENV